MSTFSFNTETGKKILHAMPLIGLIPVFDKIRMGTAADKQLQLF